MVSDVYNGTRGTMVHPIYLYHYIKVSIIMFVDNPVITALEAPTQPGSPWWKILLISLYCCDSLERGVHRSGQRVAQTGPVHHLVGRDRGHAHSWWSPQVCTWISLVIMLLAHNASLRGKIRIFRGVLTVFNYWEV